MDTPPARTPPALLPALGRFLSNFRWMFMPLGLLSLVAVGVHAAADTLDDRILTVVDACDAAFDGLVGRWAATQGLVDLLSLQGRTLLARGLTLAWELSADWVLALPALGWREVHVRRVRDPLRALRDPEAPGGWRALLTRALREPTPIRWVRPLATAAVVAAGACAVARSVQGATYLAWRGLLGEAVSGGVARVLALAVLVGVLASLGGRAVLRNLEHADTVCREEGRTRAGALRAGLVGSVLVAPLALAAWLDATPLLSFFR